MNYRLNNDASVTGTGFQEYLEGFNYKKIEAVFGRPLSREGDGKISGEWHFQDGEGGVWSLYDYKETDLYSRGKPTVAEWRNSIKDQQYHIGGRGKHGTAMFMKWLVAKLKAGATPGAKPVEAEIQRPIRKMMEHIEDASHHVRNVEGMSEAQKERIHKGFEAVAEVLYEIRFPKGAPLEII